MQFVLISLLILALSIPSLSLGGSIWKDEFDLNTIKKEVSSPWTTEARPWVIGGTSLTAALLLTRKYTVDPVQKEFSENKPLGKLSPIGDYGGQFIPNALYSLGMASAYWFTGKDQYGRYGWIMMKASLYAVTTSTLLKVTVQEPRPNDKSDTKSFPSGHTTAAFAFSSVVLAEHGLYPYGLAAMSLATLTGFSRINDNKHYLHDVVAGATIGMAFGMGLSQVRKSSFNDRSVEDSKTLTSEHSALLLTPVFTADFVGIAATYTLK